MTRTYLTYSRDVGDFKHDLIRLCKNGLYGIRLINKGKSTDQFIRRIEEILTYSRDHKLNLDILIDLPGEKPLIGYIGEGRKIEKGSVYALCEEKGLLAENEIPTTNFLPRIDRTKVLLGDIVSIADGELEMKILSMKDHSIICEALNSFFLTSNRSFGIKGNKLPAHPVSEQDQKLLDQIKLTELSNQVRILVSFVTKSDHVKHIRDISPNFRVISKIETIISENDLEEIIKVSDGVMLGRGDLTGTSKMSAVFPFQKNVIEICKTFNKELILATGLFGDLKNSNKPSISDILDFGYLRNLNVDSFLIAGSNAIHYPFETLDLITNFEEIDG